MYCHGNPIMFNDPDGHESIKDEKTRKIVAAELDMSQCEDLNNSRNPYVKDAQSLPADAKGLYDIDGGKVIATKYHSQRDNATSDPPVSGGNMCNLTALATNMEQMGIPQKYPGRQYEDELYDVAKSKGSGGSSIWNDPIGTYNKILPEYTDKKVAYISKGSLSKNIKAIQDSIDKGIPVIAAGWTTPHGHIMTIIGYNNHGFILHDSNGDRNTGYSNHNGAYVNYGYGQWEIGSTWQIYLK